MTTPTPPLCPRGHGPMKLVHVTQGEGEYEIDLGYFWGCVNDDDTKPEYCDECEDFHDPDKSGLERWQEPDKEFLKASRMPEYTEGQAAFRAGIVASKNPYKAEGKRVAWLAGWNYDACEAVIAKLSELEPKQLNLFVESE